ncbi:photosystem I reaction center subunit VIII [Mastigocoleus testarum]|uniref:Photosystem I reaction center subunit VIII n=1 Tax=Mastigocoleus testarum BC008 TaxID=371196 RepID=A0A0V7ZG68_9CYAN|nr:photosystem I reaction center subunit VIII [Mastigocoleus testarum]KST63589.1 photosystem I reaction center subunit VIII [Mastigocoleus testarum BC008]KST64163.1 photosystem I reaction center subunit VIII [Mastigocoleus testarum BC008]
MVDMTQLTGEYAASWLPWIMIPLVFYILPFPVFALVFLWIQKEDGDDERSSSADRPMGNVTNINF